MICPYCSSEISDGAVFCTNCGKKIEVQPQPAAAPQPEVAPQPEPVVQQEVQPQPAAAPQPEPVVQQEVQPQPAAAPQPEPVVQQEVQPQPAAAPQPTQAPQPEVQSSEFTAQPTQAPQPEVQSGEFTAQPTQAQPQPEVQPQTQYEYQPQQTVAAQAQPQPEVQPQTQYEYQPQQTMAAQPQQNPPKQKGSHKWLIPVIIIVVVLVLGAVGAFAYFKFFADGLSSAGKKNANAVTIQKDDELFVIKDVTAKTLEELKVSDVIEEYDSVLGIDDSGKYLFFYTDYDEDDYYGTLCYIDISKISSDEQKTEANIIEVADKVAYSLPVKDNRIIYVTIKEKAYYFDGQESYEIDGDIYDMYVNEDGTDAIYSSYYEKDDSLNLCGIKLDGKSEPYDIDDGVSYVDYCDGETVIYTKETDDGYDIYVGDRSGNTDKIAEDAVIYGVDSDTLNVWYGVGSDTGSTYDYYDYVDDDIEGQGGINAYDYMTPISQEEALDALGMTLEDFEYFCYEDDEMEEYCEDELYYYGTGTLIVTYYYRNDKNEWFSHTESQYDEFLDAVYYGPEYALDVDEVRDALAEEVSISTYRDIYMYDGKDSEKIGENANNVSFEDHGIIFYDEVKDPGADIEPVETLSYLMEYYDDIDEIKSLIEDDIQYSSLYASDAIHKMSVNGEEGEEIDVDSDDFYMYVYNDGKNVIMTDYEDGEDDGNKLIAYTIKGNELKEDGVITKSGVILGERDGVLYYFDDIDYDNYERTLMKWNGKDGEVVAKGINGAFIYQMGDSIISYEGKDEYDCDLYYYEDGKGTKIKSGVDAYNDNLSVLSDSMLLFLRDGDLYLVKDFEEPVRISKDVDYFWTVSYIPSIY